MAFGINDALPSAMFIHAKAPEDVLKQHADGKQIVTLVDSVESSGKTMVKFVRHIRTLHPTIRIIIVAGVVQQQCIQKGSLATMTADDGTIDVIMLRRSDEIASLLATD